MGAPWIYRKACIGCSIDIWNDPDSRHELDPENEQCDECYKEYAAAIERTVLDETREAICQVPAQPERKSDQ